MKKREEEEAASIWDCGSPLYDSHEIASLGHLLERHTMALPFSCSSSRFTIPPTTSSSNKGYMAKKEGLHEVGSVTKFVGSKLWKRKISGESKEKAKKLWIGFHGICRGVGLCKKKY
ncbi:hypothetical protein RGQ29_010786 [Quercus rubra]|uniref:Uncharacterized protein n=1 Tax=Quercus rubra TaxID=3512 RepID=A0AAN7FZ91_QUERU|nr:hypothetical protein RGQ29_010786 [Quercus rubra]